MNGLQNETHFSRCSEDGNSDAAIEFAGTDGYTIEPRGVNICSYIDV